MANAPAANPAPPNPALSTLPAAPRILIIRFSSLGDVVKCTALPRLIKAAFPDARITMLTASDYLELIADNPHLDQAIGLNRREGRAGFNRLVARLRKAPFDLIVDVHHSLRSRLLGLYLRGRRTRYSKRSLQRFLLLNFRINAYSEPMGKEVDFLEGLKPYGVRDDDQGTELHLGRVAADERMRGRMAAELDQIARWRKAGLPVVGIAPIAAWDLKRWPLESFRELMRSYARETGGGLLIFGGPGDEDAHGLVNGLEPHALSLVGRTSHLESAYFASLTDVVVANDTGMTHLAEAVGTDVVTLFGPTSRELGYFPVRSTSRALELPLPCRPCTRMGEGACGHPLHKACLVGITPQAVLSEVRSMIARGGAGPGKGQGGGPANHAQAAPAP